MNKIVLLISLLIISTSCAHKEKRISNVKAALRTLDVSKVLTKQKNYVKGLNVGSCTMTNIYETSIATMGRAQMPSSFAVMYCACIEEIKDNVLKERYVEESADYVSLDGEKICQDYAMTYYQHPELMEEIIEKKYPLIDKK